MKINIFNVHFEVVMFMHNNITWFEHLDLIQKQNLCEKYAMEFINYIDLDIDFDIINDDLYDEIETFLKSKMQPKPNKREL